MTEVKLIASEYGTINDKGQLSIYNRDLFLKRVTRFPSQNIEIQIIKREGAFTHQMLKYYFSVIVPEVQKGLLYAGNDITKGDTDHMLRNKFLYIEVYNSENDRWEKKMHRLNNQESEVTFGMFKTFMEDCIRFAAQYLDWAVPYPNEIFTSSEYTESQILSLSR